MSKIVEKIISARQKFPRRFDYATKIVESMKNKGVSVSKQSVYKLGAGLKHEANFTETDIAIGHEIIALSVEFEAKKNSLLSDENNEVSPSRKGKKLYSVSSEELVTV